MTQEGSFPKSDEFDQCIDEQIEGGAGRVRHDHGGRLDIQAEEEEKTLLHGLCVRLAHNVEGIILHCGGDKSDTGDGVRADDVINVEGCAAASQPSFRGPI